jgi:alpha-tubulin suppressor-like RCC1 family protein
MCFIAAGDTVSDSGLICAGSNTFGQVGKGSCTDTNSYGSRISVVNGSGVTQRVSPTLNTEAGYQMNSVMVITMNGDAYAAGDNTYGKLGTGAAFTSCNSTYKRVQLPSGVKATAVANGDEYTAFILGDNGKVYAMGRNNNGQLGNGTTTDSKVPVEVKLPRQETVY